MQNKTLSDQAFSATLNDFQTVRDKIIDDIVTTPIHQIHLNKHTLYLKSETFQSVGSFKIRAGSSALESIPVKKLSKGIITPSAGNFGQGIARAALKRKIPITVIAPNTSSKVKITELQRMGAAVKIVNFHTWWNVMMSRYTDSSATFVHPVSELSVILGNGSIGLELIKQLPDLENIIVPVGGGGLICGIALALKAARVKCKIIACEIETSTPLKAAKLIGKPVKVARGKSWVDGIGSNSVLEEMWPLLNLLVDEVVTISHQEAAFAMQLLDKKLSIISEGAGAVAVAAGLRPQFFGTKTVSVITGGNIDTNTYAEIIAGNYNYNLN